jgi:four helix bundle protein
MTEKERFIEELKARTKELAVGIINFCELLKYKTATSVITNQLIRSSTSVGANYRAACRARSKAEFYSIMCIVVEEADETEYWLEIIEETELSNNPELLKNLKLEANEITKIMTKAKNTVYERK